MAEGAVGRCAPEQPCETIAPPHGEQRTQVTEPDAASPVAAEPPGVQPATVMPIFATPFGVVALPKAEACNAALAGVLRERAAADPRRGAPGSTPLCYRSADDWLEWSAATPAAATVSGEILRGVLTVISAVNDFPPGKLAAFSAQARGWFTIVRTDGYVPATRYPQSAWCAIYCVAAPAPAATRQDSGVLRLYESRLGTMFADATNATMRHPYATGHCVWRPVPGRVAVFPGWVRHEIALLRGPGELALVTLRVRFRTAGQEGHPGW